MSNRIDLDAYFKRIGFDGIARPDLATLRGIGFGSSSIVIAVHPLIEPEVKNAIEDAASRHWGRRWVAMSFTSATD